MKYQDFCLLLCGEQIQTEQKQRRLKRFQSNHVFWIADLRLNAQHIISAFKVTMAYPQEWVFLEDRRNIKEVNNLFKICTHASFMQPYMLEYFKCRSKQNDISFENHFNIYGHTFYTCKDTALL